MGNGLGNSLSEGSAAAEVTASASQLTLVIIHGQPVGVHPCRVMRHCQGMDASSAVQVPQHELAGAALTVCALTTAGAGVAILAVATRRAVIPAILH